MSRGDVNAYYWRMISEFLRQQGLTSSEVISLKDEFHEGLKEEMGIESMRELSREEKHQYVRDCEAHLILTYGYEVDPENNNELKFE